MFMEQCQRYSQHSTHYHMSYVSIKGFFFFFRTWSWPNLGNHNFQILSVIWGFHAGVAACSYICYSAFHLHLCLPLHFFLRVIPPIMAISKFHLSVKKPNIFCLSVLCDFHEWSSKANSSQYLKVCFLFSLCHSTFL